MKSSKCFVLTIIAAFFFNHVCWAQPITFKNNSNEEIRINYYRFVSGERPQSLAVQPNSTATFDIDTTTYPVFFVSNLQGEHSGDRNFSPTITAYTISRETSYSRRLKKTIASLKISNS